jgi:hypothetical protein
VFVVELVAPGFRWQRRSVGDPAMVPTRAPAWTLNAVEPGDIRTQPQGRTWQQRKIKRIVSVVSSISFKAAVFLKLKQEALNA